MRPTVASYYLWCGMSVAHTEIGDRRALLTVEARHAARLDLLEVRRSFYYLSVGTNTTLFSFAMSFQRSSLTCGRSTSFARPDLATTVRRASLVEMSAVPRGEPSKMVRRR